MYRPGFPASIGNYGAMAWGSIPKKHLLRDAIDFAEIAHRDAPRCSREETSEDNWRKLGRIEGAYKQLKPIEFIWGIADFRNQRATVGEN